jgi:hypothetical protein
MNSAPTALEQAIALTHAMLAAAQAADWDLLARLEIERHPLVMQQHPLNDQTRQQMADILALGKQVATLVEAGRRTAGDDWQRESGRIQAIAAYANR